jgi:hypothetical protein
MAMAMAAALSMAMATAMTHAHPTALEGHDKPHQQYLRSNHRRMGIRHDRH